MSSPPLGLVYVMNEKQPRLFALEESYFEVKKLRQKRKKETRVAENLFTKAIWKSSAFMSIIWEWFQLSMTVIVNLQFYIVVNLHWAVKSSIISIIRQHRERFSPHSWVRLMFSIFIDKMHCAMEFLIRFTTEKMHEVDVKIGILSHNRIIFVVMIEFSGIFVSTKENSRKFFIMKVKFHCEGKFRVNEFSFQH